MEGAHGRRQGRDTLPTTHGRHQPASSNHGRLLQHHYTNNPDPQDHFQGYFFPPTCTHILSLSLALSTEQEVGQSGRSVR